LSNQNHDFNLGIAKSGLFWTRIVSESATSLELEEGRARFHSNNMQILDYHDFLNSVGVTQPPIPTIPSVVSFDTRWTAKPGKKLTRLTDTANGFSGKFIDSNATLVWSANSPSTGFTFHTTPGEHPTTVSGVIGHERNGRFFSSKSDDS